MLCRRSAGLLTSRAALFARPITCSARLRNSRDGGVDTPSLTSQPRLGSDSRRPPAPETSSASTEIARNYDPSVLLTFKPASASYFTGNSVYTDNLLGLEALARRCQGLREYATPQEYPKTHWRTIEGYRADVDPTSHVRPMDYKRLVALLNKLNRIDRAVMPADVQATLDTYTRERLGADPVKRVLTPDQFGRSFGVGRRKESVARVWAVPGTGEYFVNGRAIPDFAARLHDREQLTLPLLVTDRAAAYNVWAYVDGGGTTGQAGAIKLALARAMLVHEPELKPLLRKAGCVTADRRRVERKKTGRPKARKGYTWVKR